jgi:CheY-like chemotaxis protein
LEAEGSNRIVMIVEDDRDVRDSVREALEDHGYQTVGASQGKEALELLRSSAAKPCIILLDMMMPVMDGWAFRKAQTADPALSSIPVIVLTAHSSASDTAREMGAVGFLRKPVTLQELLAAVKQECQDSG